MSSSEGTDPSVLSNQLTRLRAALAVSTVGGITLLSNPEGYIRGVISTWIVELVLGLAGAVGLDILTIWGQAQYALGTAGTTLIRPFGALGARALSSVGWLETLLFAVSRAAGPAAPIVTVVVVGIVTLSVAKGFQLLLEVLKWLT